MEAAKARPNAAVAAIFIGIFAWLAPVIAFVAGMSMYSGGNAPGDGGPDLMGFVFLFIGVIATGERVSGVGSRK